jgi:hypothetical protein
MQFGAPWFVTGVAGHAELKAEDCDDDKPQHLER